MDKRWADFMLQPQRSKLLWRDQRYSQGYPETLRYFGREIYLRWFTPCRQNQHTEKISSFPHQGNGRWSSCQCGGWFFRRDFQTDFCKTLWWINLCKWLYCISAVSQYWQYRLWAERKNSKIVWWCEEKVGRYIFWGKQNSSLPFAPCGLRFIIARYQAF